MESNGYKSYLEEKDWNIPLFNWIFSVDHKKIGLMYLAAMTTFFLTGLGLALAIKAEKLFPGADLYSARVYNSLFTLHGVIMIFLFIIPGLPAVFGNFFLPILLGAKDVSFPKLNLISFWIYIIGAILLLLSLVVSPNGPADTGWTVTVPYSVTTDTSVGLALFALFVLGWGTILTAINFIVTTHRLRAPGMSWYKMPLFIHSLYATSWIQVLATPVVGITLLLVALERVLPVGFFDAAKGGDPILFQHMFWIYSHPAVYVMILPAMGAISEILPVFSRKSIFGYKAIANSSLAIAGVGYFVWAHHMFVTGMSDMAAMLFSILTFCVGIPTAIKVFNWTATLYKGSIELTAPMILALMFIFNFTIGGLTGMTLGALSADVHVHDTDFVVAHFHYTMFGGAATALFAAMHYWFPKMFGKMYNMTHAKVASIIFFIGFQILYVPMFILGLQGQPRRYFDYLPEFTNLQQLSTVGSWILATGLIYMFWNLLYGVVKGKVASANPWRGLTLEWQIEATPSLYNFDEIPTITKGPYDYSDEDQLDGNLNLEAKD